MGEEPISELISWKGMELSSDRSLPGAETGVEVPLSHRVVQGEVLPGIGKWGWKLKSPPRLYITAWSMAVGCSLAYKACQVYATTTLSQSS